MLWRNLVVAALVGALGVGIGAIVRNQVVAIVGILLIALIFEPLLYGLAADVGRVRADRRRAGRDHRTSTRSGSTRIPTSSRRASRCS